MAILSAEEILVLQCKKKASRELAKMLREDNGISAMEYNNLILELLSLPCSEPVPVLNTNTLIDERLKKEVAGLHAKPGEYSESHMQNNLERYYSIRNAPSFLYSGSMLTPEEIHVFLQIYSEMYMLSPSFDPSIVSFLHDRLYCHFRRVMDACGNSSDVLSVYEFLKNIEK